MTYLQFCYDLNAPISWHFNLAIRNIISVPNGKLSAKKKTDSFGKTN